MCPHIKVAELNTLSDGKGITGIHRNLSMRWKIKNKITFFGFSNANLTTF